MSLNLRSYLLFFVLWLWLEQHVYFPSFLSLGSVTALRANAQQSDAQHNAGVNERETLDSVPGFICPSNCVGLPIGVFDDEHDPRESIRIFYLIMLHDEQSIEAAAPLFRSIRDPRNIVLIHVDTKARHLMPRGHDRDSNSHLNLQLWQEIRTCPCGSRVRLESIHSVEWGEWSMNEPTLWAMEVAVNEYPQDSWDVFINLAGDSLPVYNVNSMARVLSQITPHYNFVTSSSCETGLVPTNVNTFPKWWHKRKHYTRDETESDLVWMDSFNKRNVTIHIHFGSQWVILQEKFCRWLVQSLSTPTEDQRQTPSPSSALSLPAFLAQELKQSNKLMTDETFLPTVLMHSSEFAHTIPQIDSQTGFLIVPPHSPPPSSNTHGANQKMTASQTFVSFWNMTAVRYERMDEHVPTAFGKLWKHQRYDVANQTAASSKVHIPRVWGPYYLGVYDLAQIRASGALFIRKVSRHVDGNLLHLLPVRDPTQIPWIAWPDEQPITLTSKPDWFAKMKEWKREIDSFQHHDATPSISGTTSDHSGSAEETLGVFSEGNTAKQNVTASNADDEEL